MSFQRRASAFDLGRRDHTRWLGSNRYAGGAPLTLPTANLLAAYDARVGVTNVAGACSAWADQSGNGWHATQGTAGSRPTITTTEGFASLQFDGTADFLNIPSITASAGTKALYCVQSQTTFGGYRAMFDSATGRLFCGALVSGNLGLYDTTDRSSGISAAVGLSRVTFTCGGGASRVWRGATAGTATGWGADSAIGGTTRIGGGSAGGLSFGGHILALFIYNAARNTAVEDYITQEWGV